jgi:2,4-dichlorophenol 6-monooxygenase
MICDLPQNLMEPMLASTAAHRGATVRFNTEYLSHTQDREGVTVQLRDRLTGQTYEVRARYLLGADGANSRVLDDAGLPLEGKMGVSGSMNIVFDADLSKYVAHRPSVLYWVIQPGSDVGGLGIGVVRMVRPWYRWLAIWGYDLEDGPPDLTEAKATEIVHNLIGDHTIPVKIDSTSTWTVNDCFAKQLSSGRVFCLGDAVHRHPPTNGLGSNASIQDAYNLAWKLAYVLNGWADPSLLDTYDAERAPIAKQVVRRANRSLEDFPPVMQALGLLDSSDPEQMKANMAKRKEATPEAAKQRADLRAAIDGTDWVYNCHGVEMNQRYASTAVASDGTPDPGFKGDHELYYEPTTHPGAHLPHCWLLRGGDRISTLDLCGRGRFALLTGIGGEAWRTAAAEAERALGIPVDVHVIGPGADADDPYGDFARMRETEETGALLVRPDQHVGWRAQSLPADPTAELLAALRQVLGRPTGSADAPAETTAREAVTATG